MRKDRLVHLIGRIGRFDSFNSFELRFSHVHAFLLLCYAFACPFYSTFFSLRFFRLIYLFSQKREQDKRTLRTRERQKNVVCIGSSVCKSKLVLRGAKRGRGGESPRIFFLSHDGSNVCYEVLQKFLPYQNIVTHWPYMAVMTKREKLFLLCSCLRYFT